MSYSFVNRPAVRTDVIEAVKHYKEINPELALQFLFRIRVNLKFALNDKRPVTGWGSA